MKKRESKAAAVFVAAALMLVACGNRKPEPQTQPAATPPEQSTTPPAPAPVAAAVWTLTDLMGHPLSLADFKGKVVILDFWATWCPPCVKEIPHFNELAAEFGDKGLAVVGVSVDRDGVDAVKAFMKRQPINYPVVMFTPDVANTYQQYLPPEERGGIPFTFVIDREGYIRRHFVGYRPKEVFAEVVKSLL